MVDKVNYSHKVSHKGSCEVLNYRKDQNNSELGKFYRSKLTKKIIKESLNKFSVIIFLLNKFYKSNILKAFWCDWFFGIFGTIK